MAQTFLSSNLLMIKHAIQKQATLAQPAFPK
jgi:hypothetical protein